MSVPAQWVAEWWAVRAEETKDWDAWDLEHTNHDAELTYDAFLQYFDIVGWSSFKTAVIETGVEIGAVSSWMQSASGRSYGKATSIGDL
jgi:hypothetical protein